jgi:hypothetical protein
MTVAWDENKLTTGAILRATRIPSTIEFRPEITLFERALNNRIPANAATAVALSRPSRMGCWDTSNNEGSAREDNKKIGALHLAWNKEDRTIVQVINDGCPDVKGLDFMSGVFTEFESKLSMSWAW